MQLLSLKLVNFRQHKDTTVEFSTGMTAIIGPNGTGKSTLLEAIGFALYNENRGKKETIRNNWANTGAYSVTLEFSLQEKTYRVIRKNTNAELLLLREGAAPLKLADGQEGTTNKCKSLIGLTHQQFTSSFCAEQKELAFLTSISKQERQKEVGIMLGLEPIRVARDESNRLRKEADRRVGEYEPLVSSLNLAETKRILKDSEANASTLIAKIATLEVEVQEKKASEPAHIKRKEAAEKWKQLDREFRELSDKASGVKSSLPTLESNVKDQVLRVERLATVTQSKIRFEVAKQEAERQQKLRDAEKGIETKREMVAQQAERISIAEAEMAKMESGDIESAEKRLIEAQEKLALHLVKQENYQQDQQKASKDRASTMATLSTQLTAAKKSLAHAQSMASEGKCNECGQLLGGTFTQNLEKQELAVLQGEKNLAEAEDTERKGSEEYEKCLAALKTDRTSLEAEVQKAQSAKLATLAIVERKKAVMEGIEESKKSLAQLKAEIEAFKPQFDQAAHQRALEEVQAMEPGYKEALSLQSAPSDLKKAQDQLESTQKELSLLRKLGTEKIEEKAKLGFETADDVEAAIRAMDLFEGNLKGLLAELQHHQSLLESEQKALAANKKVVEDGEKLNSLLNQFRDAQILNRVTEIELNNLLRKLNSSLLPDIEAGANYYLQVLTGNRYAELKLDTNFEATIIDDNLAKPIISGGEEDIVALALRLAFCELVQQRNGTGLSLLILDEVFGSLDASRRQAVQNCLMDLRSRFNQILVISHIEEINQIADNTITLDLSPDRQSTIVVQDNLDLGMLQMEIGV